jgi:hypothetical protein
MQTAPYSFNPRAATEIRMFADIIFDIYNEFEGVKCTTCGHLELGFLL